MEKEKFKELPSKCGVYIFKDSKGKVLYVGKAKNIKERVANHFSSKDPKHVLLIEKTKYIDYYLCPTEPQALLLEQALIKENSPPFNIELRDDKSYPYVRISLDEFPSISIVRPKDKTDALYLGPFTNKKILRQALNFIRKIFPFRTCKRMKKKACLNYHLNLCPAPCQNKIRKEDYNKNIKRIIKILKGERRDLIQELENEMQKLAKELRFEEAAILREKLKALLAIYEGMRGYIQEATLLKDILGLKKLPRIIEGFDVSNLGGKLACGAMVRFVEGEPDKSNYRRFKIKQAFTKSDLDMLAEIVRRRYTRLLKEKKELPDLILIDGGLAHLHTAKKELKKLGLDIYVISIAKREEKIYTDLREEPLILPKNSPGLQLIQRIRNEAHRFSKSYHKILQRKSLYRKD